LRPRDAGEVAEFLRAHAQSATPVVLRGGGGKTAFGRPPEPGDATLDLGGLAGVTLYEPEELVLTARPGTPLADIAAVIAQRRQCLGFEPPEFGALFGVPDRLSTLGGAVGSGWSGPRRIRAGAVRDHVLGAAAIGGDGRIFRSGGRVVKNVTGFDLPKLLTGSHGTLAAMTEITIKVSPAPETSRTLVVWGLDDQAAIRLLGDALGGPFDIAGAAHLPDAAAGRSAARAVATAGGAATLIRLEGFGPSVQDRLQALMRRIGAADRAVLDGEPAAALWAEIRDVARLIDPDAMLWRLSVAPADAAETVARIRRSIPADALYDWAGGLVWLAVAADEGCARIVRGALSTGHALLMRAPPALRTAIPVFHPRPAAVAALEARVKAAFDPAGILSPRLRLPEF
jgi:glycolate oxidase FAD binding subunit